MTDTHPIKYYFLPVEIIHLLIDMIPIYRRKVCKQIDFFTSHSSIFTKLYPLSFNYNRCYKQITDAIKRNEVDYCRQHYALESINERERSNITWDNGSFIKGSGVYVSYWLKAVKYGRTEIMGIFYEIDAKAHSPSYNLSLESISLKKLIRLIPNSSTLRWFLDINCEKKLSSLWIIGITREALKREYIDCLMWLHNHVPKIANHDPLPYTYLEYTIITYASVGSINNLIRRIKDKRLNVLKWCRQQWWRMVIDWDHCIVA
jgi:hypothetical protein